MHKPGKIEVLFMLAALVCIAGIGDAWAVSPTKITDVKISEDARRVVVKADGPLPSTCLDRVEGGSRLVIDIPGAVLGDIDRTIRNPRNSTMAANVSRVRDGVRLALDFGNAAIPDYKMKVMDHCLIVFVSTAGSYVSRHGESSFSSPAGAAALTQHRPAPSSSHRQRPGSYDKNDLTVCSAEVINGLVVLQVASKRREGRTYRITLGLNLDNLGFNSATIARDREQTVSGLVHR